jgi:hypothetical protein
MSLDRSSAPREERLATPPGADDPVANPGPADVGRPTGRSGLGDRLMQRLRRRPLALEQADGPHGLHVLDESYCDLPDGSGGQIALRRIEGGHWVETCVPER